MSRFVDGPWRRNIQNSEIPFARVGYWTLVKVTLDIAACCALIKTQ